MRTPPPINNVTPINSRIPATVWRPVLACGGALLVGGVLASQLMKAPVQTVADAGNEEVVWHMAVPASDVTLVQSVPVSGATITGKMAPVADVLGTSPVGGEVARWVVEPGQKVEKSQSVVEISSGAASRAPSGAEIQQTQAEKAQIQASDSQMAMAGKMTLAQRQLGEAKARVDEAQVKVAQARDLVKRLRNGESVSLPGKTRRKTEVANISPEQAASVKQLKTAQSALSASQDAADKAHAEVKAADKALADARNQIDITGVQVESVENKFTNQKATADEVQGARSALNDAQATLKTATTRLDTAKRNASASDANLVQSQTNLQKIQATAGSMEADPTTEPTAADDTVSVEQAATLVASALQESRDAAREAERLKNRIDSYKSQANQGQQALETASKQLQNAQENVIESAPRPKFTAALAPVAGQVVWISRLAREVGTGDRVFGISTGKKSRVVFEDKTQLWKNVKAGQVVQAVAAPAAQPTIAPIASSTPSSTTTTAGIQPLFAAIPLQIRLVKINTPETPEAPATVEGEIVGDTAAATLSNDMEIIASVPTNTKSLPSVPATALISYEDKNLVAVLTPSDKKALSEASPEVTTSSPVAEPTSALPTPAASPTETPKPAFYRLEWRTVTFGKSDGIRTEIKSGVKVGDHILLNAATFLAQAPPDSDSMPLVELTNS